jgi:hypothetical protein
LQDADVSAIFYAESDKHLLRNARLAEAFAEAEEGHSLSAVASAKADVRFT